LPPPSPAADPTPLTPGTWSADTLVPGKNYSIVYTVDVTDTHREAWFYMKKLTADEADPGLFIRHNEAPTRTLYDGPGQRAVQDHPVSFRRDAASYVLKTGKYYAISYGYKTPDTKVQFKADLYNCKNKDCGKALGSGTCAPETGVCTCSDGWNTDSYCTSQIVTDAKPATPYARLLEAETTVYYKFANLADNGYELNFAGSRQETQGQAYVIAALGRVPTLSDNDAVQSIYSGQPDFFLHIPHEQYVGGDWIVGLIAPKTNTMNFTFTAQLHDCPSGCSGKGTCDSATATCKCEEGFTSAKDCSLSATALTHSEPIEATLQPFVKLHFPVLVPEAYSQADVEMVIHLKAAADDRDYARMFLLHDGQPGKYKFDMVSPLPTAKSQSIFVPAAKFSKGSYTLSLESVSANPVKYSLSMEFNPHCPSACGINGRCSALGTCVCNEGWIGHDCQINSDVCEDKYGLVSNGLSAGYVFLVVVLALIVGGGLGAFVGRKFASPPAEEPMPQYNELNA
jgi:hypothetical protein